MKIGIFGGCFNPPHKMHKEIALNLIKNKYVDKVIYVPTGNKYQKQKLLPDYDRYQMLKLMIGNNKNLEVSNYEFKDELIYTYQTLDFFKKKYPSDELYLIMGADNLDEFDTWYNYKYILENYKLLVINRDDYKIENLITKYYNYSNKIFFVQQENNFISSTYIRANIKSEDIKKYLETKVLDYIKLNKLYEE